MQGAGYQGAGVVEAREEVGWKVDKEVAVSFSTAATAAGPAPSFHPPLPLAPRQVHCLRDHTEAAALDFLPHHFLLCSVGDAGERLRLRLGRLPLCAEFDG